MRIGRGMLAAAAAVILGACEPVQPPPTAAPSLADSADQVMWGLRHNLTREGVRQAELLADTAFFFDDGTRFELRGVTVRFYTAQGARSGVLTSREGSYDSRTSEMEARGNVVVVGEDGRRLETEQLRFHQTRDEISSDTSFVVREAGRRMEGIGFVSNSDLTAWRCLRSCRGVGPVTLPAQ